MFNSSVRMIIDSLRMEAHILMFALVFFFLGCLAANIRIQNQGNFQQYFSFNPNLPFSIWIYILKILVFFLLWFLFFVWFPILKVLFHQLILFPLNLFTHLIAGFFFISDFWLLNFAHADTNQLNPIKNERKKTIKIISSKLKSNWLWNR